MSTPPALPSSRQWPQQHRDDDLPGAANSDRHVACVVPAYGGRAAQRRGRGCSIAPSGKPVGSAVQWCSRCGSTVLPLTPTASGGWLPPARLPNPLVRRCAKKQHSSDHPARQSVTVPSGGGRSPRSSRRDLPWCTDTDAPGAELASELGGRLGVAAVPRGDVHPGGCHGSAVGGIQMSFRTPSQQFETPGGRPRIAAVQELGPGR